MILVQVCQCSSAKFASEPGLHYFQKKLQRQYLYLLQHLDSSWNTSPCLLKLLGVLAPITVLLRLLELHLSLSSFSWEAPPSQLPGSIFLPLLHHPFGAAARRVRPLGPWQAGAFRATGSISQSVAPSSSPAATGPACPAPCVCQGDSSCVTYASSVSTNPISLNKCS